MLNSKFIEIYIPHFSRELFYIILIKILWIDIFEIYRVFHFYLGIKMFYD